VFQRRLAGKDPIKHAMRVAELKRSLETTGEPFRVPIEVYDNGDGVYWIMSVHHRHAA
jgi:hypothetical protein